MFLVKWGHKLVSLVSTAALILFGRNVAPDYRSGGVKQEHDDRTRAAQKLAGSIIKLDLRYDMLGAIRSRLRKRTKLQRYQGQAVDHLAKLREKQTIFSPLYESLARRRVSILRAKIVQANAVISRTAGEQMQDLFRSHGVDVTPDTISRMCETLAAYVESEGGTRAISKYMTGRWIRDPAGFAAWFIWMRLGFYALIHSGSLSQSEIVAGALIFAGSAGLWGAGILFNALMRRQLQDEIAEALLMLPAGDVALFSAFECG